MRRFPARRGLLIAVFAGVVASCSGNPPTPAPTPLHPGTAATVTPTPSGNPTDVAAAAAIAAVQKLYIDFKAMADSGSSTSYRRDFTANCQPCSTDAKFIEGLTQHQQTLAGGAFHVSGLAVVWNKPDLVVVQGLLSHPRLHIMSGQRTIREIAALETTRFIWHVRPTADGWKIESAEAIR